MVEERWVEFLTRMRQDEVGILAFNFGDHESFVALLICLEFNIRDVFHLVADERIVSQK